jgi:hypothetical protein
MVAGKSPLFRRFKRESREMMNASACNSAADKRPVLDAARLFAPAIAKFYARRSYVIVPSALSRQTCEAILCSLKETVFIHHSEPDRREATDFYTKNGADLVAVSPAVGLIESELSDWISRIAGAPYVPLDNRKMGISVNVVLGKGGFFAHRDRNAITVVLFLNDQDSRELLIYPEFRRLQKLLSLLPGNIGARAYNAVRRILWKSLGARRIMPSAGYLIAFNRLVHRVADVRPGGTRVTLVVGLDRPDVSSQHIGEYYGYGEAKHRLPQLAQVCPA